MPTYHVRSPEMDMYANPSVDKVVLLQSGHLPAVFSPGEDYWRRNQSLGPATGMSDVEFDTLVAAAEVAVRANLALVDLAGRYGAHTGFGIAPVLQLSMNPSDVLAASKQLDFLDDLVRTGRKN